MKNYHVALMIMSALVINNIIADEIEEIIERELEQGKLNSDGEIWLSARYVFAY
jgi:hypothetical protein